MLGACPSLTHTQLDDRWMRTILTLKAKFGPDCAGRATIVALPRFGEPDVAKGVCVPEALAPEKSGCYAELEALVTYLRGLAPQ